MVNNYMRDVQQISFGSMIEHYKWLQEHYQAQDGVKEVGCYCGNDGRIYSSYINTRE
jgi:hypothetical protein